MMKYRLLDNGCWEWTGGVGGGGYGYVWIGGTSYRAHRVMYERVNGTIPAGLTLDHLCRNRKCVNPDHLEAVTPRENTLRGETVAGRNAQKTICAHGHPFDADNTYHRPDRPHGRGRLCRTCRKT